ncbi:MAG: SLC13 family permease [Candidatus Hydrogenedentota bacterium]
MGWEAWFALGVVALIFTGLAMNFASDALLVGGVVALGLAGILSPTEMFEGFSNKGMLTVGALYIVTAGLRETGALQTLGNWVLGRARNEDSVLRRLTGIAAMSAFLNNTPIVAMFIPIVENWCRKHQVSPSRLLIPVSYFSILGGTCTLIGTSTNLVVNGLMIEAVKTDPSLGDSLYEIGLFELGRVGLPYAVIGTAYLLLFGRFLLPKRMGAREQLDATSREYLANMRIEPGCRLAGKTVEEAGLRRLTGLFLIEIWRDDRLISPVGPTEVLEEGDILTFTGVVSNIVDLEKIAGLVPFVDEDYESQATARRHETLCEAVVSRTSPLINRNVREANFRARYNAAVVAVHRGGQRLQGRVGDIELQAGDTLLLQAGPHFAEAHRNNSDFFLVSGVQDSRAVRHDKTVIAFGLLGLLMLLMTTGAMQIVLAAFLVAGLMVATRCVSVFQARRSIDWQTLITIGAAFGLGTGLVNSGAVDVISDTVVAFMGPWGPRALLLGVYLMTTFFTEIITNNAAAALMFPFALAIAQGLGVDPRPFAMAIAFAASASFLTPLGYQTNLMVYGPGRYNLRDFVRIGLPLNLALMTTAIILVPIAWPF